MIKTLILFLFLTNGCVFSVINENVIDFRKSCSSNSLKTLFLPSKEGDIDNFVIYVSRNNSKCQLDMFSTFQNVGLIVVLEFDKKMECKPGELIVQDDNIIDVCAKKIHQIYLHPKIVDHILVKLNFSVVNISSNIKLVITAAYTLSRQLTSCKEIGKIPCVVGNRTVCIGRSLECDGEINCGTKERFDENIEVCKVSGGKILQVVMFTFAVILFGLFTIYHMVKKSMKCDPVHFFFCDKPFNRSTAKPQTKPMKKSTSQDSSSKSAEEYLTTVYFSSYQLPPSTPSESNKNSDFEKSSHPTTLASPSIRRLSEKVKKNMMLPSTEELLPKFTFYSTQTRTKFP
ncbi:uncharacterized protein LOC126891630 [Diabrotica virgifera virgifera]|uniref:Uncharacterized protein n=1 Tax=Diabrotica virgifera virgifera TaxID=50390 RepID=A0ABM5L2Z1_DIAVI|nr:uncharacterized protein LOC126891630 [Diabrotica virgifera virgifera]